MNSVDFNTLSQEYEYRLDNNSEAYHEGHAYQEVIGTKKFTPLVTLVIKIVSFVFFIFKSDYFNKLILKYYPEKKFNVNRDTLPDNLYIDLYSYLYNDNKINYAEAPERAKSNRNFVSIAVKKEPRIIQQIKIIFQYDKTIMLEAINAGASLENTQKEIQDDKKIVLAAVNKDAEQILFASDRLKKDPDVIEAALKKDGYETLAFLPVEYSSMERYVALAVAQNGHALSLASKELRNNFKIALAAIEKTPAAIAYLSPELSKNRQLMVAAMRKDPKVWAFVSEELWQDPEFLSLCEPAIRANLQKPKISDPNEALKELTQSGYNYLKLNDTLKRDPKFIKLALEKSSGWFMLRFIPADLRNQKINFIRAIENTPRKERRLFAQFTPENLLNDEEVAQALVRIQGLNLKYLPKFQNNKKIILGMADIKHYFSLLFASRELQKDPEVYETFYAAYPNFIFALPETLRLEMAEKCLVACKGYGNLPHYLKWEKKLAIKALQNDIDIESVPEELKANPEVKFYSDAAQKRLQDKEKSAIRHFSE